MAKKKPNKRKQPIQEVDGLPMLNVPVEFGGSVSIGKGTVRIGVKCPRLSLNIEAAEGVFCGRRLTGKVVSCNADVDPDQTHFEGMDDTREVNGVFDVRHFTVSTEHISASLTFAKNEIECEQLAEFAGGTGRLIIQNAGAIPDDDAEDAEDKETE